MLKSRDNFPPGGFKYRQAETGWEAPRHLSFNDTVAQIIQHRRANPQHNLKLDAESVGQELEAYTIARMKNIKGGAAYLIGEDPVNLPKSVPLRERALSLAAGAKKFVSNSVAGASLWLKWFGQDAVNQEAAELRASICVPCPAHVKGNIGQRFNQAVARELQAVFGALKERNLSTSHDAELGACDICDCPMRAKVWVPLALIESEMKPETREKLPAHCWIIRKL